MARRRLVPRHAPRDGGTPPVYLSFDDELDLEELRHALAQLLWDIEENYPQRLMKQGRMPLDTPMCLVKDDP